MMIFRSLFALALALLSVITHATTIQSWQNANGARVYFIEAHDLPIIDVSVSFPAGSAHDVPEKAGVANLTRHMLAQGAGGLTDDDIARRFGDIGASLGGDFDQDRAAISVRTLSAAPQKTQALALFETVLSQPTFDARILAREKTRLIASLKEADTKPETIADKAFAKALYGTHPYALPEPGQPGTVATITRDDLASFYRRYYGAANAVVAIVGDMSRDDARALGERLTAGLPVQTEPVAPIPAVALPAKAQDVRIAHPATQAHVLMGYPGIKRIDPDYFPLIVGNYIFGGGGFVSRLTTEIREKRGLVYSAYSYFMPMMQAGPFQIGLQTQKSQVDETLDLARQTLKRFIAEGPTEKELRAAKDNLIGSFPLRLDSNKKLLGYLEVIGFYGLPLTYLDDYPKRVAQVSVADIKRAFQTRINPDKMVTVVVGGAP